MNVVQPFGKKDWLFAVALVAAVFVVYWHCWHAGFLPDDDAHLLENPVLKPGGLAKIWVPGEYLNYWPLTYTAYWLQYQLWDLQPLGYHLVNIALHTLAALLVWRLLLRLPVPGAMFAAAIFALHPVNVEGVAWISQLKGILALVFALTSVLFYLSNERHASFWRYGLAIIAFLLSALAKGTALTLPVVLLACTWWQRGRIQWRDVLRITPYLLIGAAMAGLEVWTQHNVAQEEVVRSDGFLSRAAVAGCALWFYLGKLIWPLDLSPIYPRWKIEELNVFWYLPGFIWVALLALAWWQRRTWGRPVVMLIVCYSALLLPVLGFVNITFMRESLVADHWQYIATIVPCAVLAGVATTLARRFLRPPVAITSAMAPLLLLAILSCSQTVIYENAKGFYEATIAHNPDCWLAENNLGMVLAGDGQADLAIVHFEKALEIKPDYAEAYNNRGAVLLGRGKISLAIDNFQRALAIKPNFAQAHNNLGNALYARGELGPAIAEYRKSLESKADFAEAENNLGNALARSGHAESAITHFEKALTINPDYAEAHYNLANALLGLGRAESAIAEYQTALKFNPEYVDAHCNLATALARRGELDSAISHYQRALEIQPDNKLARQNLDFLLSQPKRP